MDFGFAMISFIAPGNLTVCEQDNQQLKTANHGSYVSSLEDIIINITFVQWLFSCSNRFLNNE